MTPIIETIVMTVCSLTYLDDGLSYPERCKEIEEIFNIKLIKQPSKTTQS